MLRKTVAVLVGCVLSISTPPFAVADGNGDLRNAEQLYNRSLYSSSLAMLDARTEDPATLFLIGRNYYMLGEFNKASKYLKKAVNAAPDSSEYVHWLGRAYSERAGLVNPLSAALLRRKAGTAFDRAVQLNPRNLEALSDLFYFYVKTPRIFGGGLDKAETVAEKISAADPYEGFNKMCELAPKRSGLRERAKVTERSSAAGERKDALEKDSCTSPSGDQ